MLSIDEKLNCLRAAEMFSEASDSILEKLASMTHEVSFLEGDTVIVQGTSCVDLFVSIRGEFSILIREGDIEREIVKLNGPSKVVGEIGAVSGGLNATATVRVESESADFLRLNGEEFHLALMAEPELAANVLRSLARYLKDR